MNVELDLSFIEWEQMDISNTELVRILGRFRTNIYVTHCLKYPKITTLNDLVIKYD